MFGGKGISIWFFIGTQLLIYGFIIFVANVWETYHPTMHREIVLKGLNFGIWWGLLLLVIGLVYFISFRPWKKKKLIP
jgi:hypothetical protein